MNKFKQAQKLISELKQRQMWNNCTNETKLIAALEQDKGCYLGFDPTAASLHLGNYLGICVLKHFQLHGFKTCAVLGGATGMIGDPSFRDRERQLLSDDVINVNSAKIAKQLQQLVACDQFVNNMEFYSDMNVIAYLRDVGKLINVNYLLEKESLKERLKTGLSYTEFSYPLMQGWDFLSLYRKYQVHIQIGGSDQWGNITTGLEIIRKILANDDNNGEAFAGLTFNLLTDCRGKKFGKSENNALFLDPTLTHPYKIYQFLLNSDDLDVHKYLLNLTFLSIAEITQIMDQHNANPVKKFAQTRLAFQLVRDIHGDRVAQQCVDLSHKLFYGETKNLSVDDFVALSSVLNTVTTQTSIKLVDALVQTKLVASMAEAKRLIRGGGVGVFGDKVSDPEMELTPKNAIDNYVLLQKGKKNHALIVWQ